ncbi:MAG: CHRD domain-containing protein [Betaproteobacteria bacterium]|nr:CHRD domain-containing protein [Betaproteobacteria bacterium]
MNGILKYAAVALALSGLLSACSGSSSSADPAVLSATLTPTQENPPVLSSASGSATFSFFEASGELMGSVTTSGVAANAAHIHSGAAGVNGPIIITLNGTATLSDPSIVVWNVPAQTILTAEQSAALLAGNLYVNVHSMAFPGGQIRGQIGQEVRSAIMTGTQENPPVVTSATGNGIVSVDPKTRALTARLVTSGVVGTAAHIHAGAIGVNGAVSVALTETAPGSGIWVAPAGTLLSEALYTSYKAGGLYFNVHSAANAGGEIRGQIGLDVTDVAMSGAQEVPPVTGGGSASARVIVNPITRELSGTITANGVVATAAHLHSGVFGVNAPVLVSAAQATAGSATWNLAPTTLTADQYRALLFGDMYTNMHSAAFPGGEARGQVGKVIRTANLSAAQEVPPSTSTATGRGRIELDPVTLGLTVALTTSGVTGTAAHIHTGASGANGSVLVPLVQGPTNTWTAAATTLTAAQAATLAAGGMYFNVHSAAFPGGEIRAQITGLD